MEAKRDMSDSTIGSQAADQEELVFRISPLIGLTLVSFYLALTLPLPVLANITHHGSAAPWLWGAIAAGAIALVAALSERVIVNSAGIGVYYPRWVPRWFRRSWLLAWEELQTLKPRSTGQGGLVYYLVSRSGAAYLLPMRVVGFARLVAAIQARTGIDTSSVRPLAQPWMYSILLGLTLLLALADAWVLWTASALPPQPY